LASVTKKDLEQWQAWDEQIRALRRQASDLAKLQAELEEQKLSPWVREHGGPELCCVRSGFRLAIVLKDGSPSWKKEFIKVAGEGAAEAIIASLPKKEALSVQKVD
jgi:hypothetical protein